MSKRTMILAVFMVMAFACVAYAGNVVVPSETEDVTAFDQAVSDSKHKFAEEKKNMNKGESTKNQERYMEKKSVGEGKEIDEGEIDESKKQIKNQYQYKKQEKKAVKEQKKLMKKDAVAEEAKKMKSEGEETKNQYRDRERNEYMKGETNGSVNSYGPGSGMGSENPAEVVPDKDKRPEGAGTGEGQGGK